MYSVDGVMDLLGQHSAERESYIYARVSSEKQRGDLERQINELQEAYPGHHVIHDVGSGVNFKRHGLQTILERVMCGLVKEIVVLHKDRLARIAFDLLEYIFTKAGAKIVVHSKAGGPDDDLADDLLAVTTHFVASYNGRRAAENRKRRNKEVTTRTKKTKEELRTPDSSQED